MTWENVTERIRYLQDWTPPSQRHRLIQERSRSPYSLRGSSGKGGTGGGGGTISTDIVKKPAMGEYMSQPATSLKEEMVSLKKKVECLTAENNALRKTKRDIEASLAHTKVELAESEAKVAESDFVAAESRAKMNALDHDVEKLCQLSKMLSDENASLQITVKQKDEEVKELKAQVEDLKKLIEEAEKEGAELKKEVERLHHLDELAEQKQIEILEGQREDFEKQLEQYKAENEAVYKELELLRNGKDEEAVAAAAAAAAIVAAAEAEKAAATALEKAEKAAAAAAAEAEATKEKEKWGIIKLEQEVERLKMETEEAEVRAEAAETRAERTEASYTAEMKQLSEQVLKLMAEVEGEKQRRSEVEAELERLQSNVGSVAAAAAAIVGVADGMSDVSNVESVVKELIADTPSSAGTTTDLDVVELSRRLSSLLYYRENSPEAERVVQLEFQKMSSAFSKGLTHVEQEIIEWKSKVQALEDALAAAKESAVSSQDTANSLLTDLNAVAGFLKKTPEASPSPAAAAQVLLPPLPIQASTPQRTLRPVQSNFVPATVASGALGTGLLAAFHMLRARPPPTS